MILKIFQVSQSLTFISRVLKQRIEVNMTEVVIKRLQTSLHCSVVV